MIYRLGKQAKDHGSCRLKDDLGRLHHKATSAPQDEFPDGKLRSPSSDALVLDSLPTALLSVQTGTASTSSSQPSATSSRQPVPAHAAYISNGRDPNALPIAPSRPPAISPRRERGLQHEKQSNTQTYRSRSQSHAPSELSFQQASKQRSLVSGEAANGGYRRPMTESAMHRTRPWSSRNPPTQPKHPRTSHQPSHLTSERVNRVSSRPHTHHSVHAINASNLTDAMHRQHAAEAAAAAATPLPLQKAAMRPTRSTSIRKETPVVMHKDSQGSFVGSSPPVAPRTRSLFDTSSSACSSHTRSGTPLAAVKPAAKPATVRKHDVLRPALPSPHYEVPVQPPVLAAQGKQQFAPAAAKAPAPAVHTLNQLEPLARASTTSRTAPTAHYSIPPPTAVPPPVVSASPAATTSAAGTRVPVAEMPDSPSAPEPCSSVPVQKLAAVESYSHMDGRTEELRLARDLFARRAPPNPSQRQQTPRCTSATATNNPRTVIPPPKACAPVITKPTKDSKPCVPGPLPQAATAGQVTTAAPLGSSPEATESAGASMIVTSAHAAGSSPATPADGEPPGNSAYSSLNDAVPVLSGSVEVARSAILEDFFDAVLRIAGNDSASPLQALTAGANSTEMGRDESSSSLFFPEHGPGDCRQGFQERRGGSAYWANNRRASAPHPQAAASVKPLLEGRFSSGFAPQGGLDLGVSIESPRPEDFQPDPESALAPAVQPSRSSRASCMRAPSHVRWDTDLPGSSPESATTGPARRVRFAESTETSNADAHLRTPQRSRTLSRFHRGSPAGASRSRARSFARNRSAMRAHSAGRAREMASGNAAMPFHSPAASAELDLGESSPLRPCLPILNRINSNLSNDSESLPPPSTPSDSAHSANAVAITTTSASEWYSGELQQPQFHPSQFPGTTPGVSAGSLAPRPVRRPSAGTSPGPVHRLHMEAAAGNLCLPAGTTPPVGPSGGQRTVELQPYEFEIMLPGGPCGPAVLTPFDTMPVQRTPRAAVAAARGTGAASATPADGAAEEGSCDYSSSGVSVTSTMLADEGSVVSALCAQDVENGMRFLSDDVTETESPSCSTSSNSDSAMDCYPDGASDEEAAAEHHAPEVWNAPEASPQLHEAVTVMRRLWWIQVRAEEQEQLRCSHRMYDEGAGGSAALLMEVQGRSASMEHSGALPAEMFAIDGLDD